MKKVLILFLLLLCMYNVSAQYHLAYKECAYLAIPDPPYNGYVAHALWNVNNSNLTFDAADEAGAIIYPNHYFDETSLVTCSYRYEYYRNGRYQTATSSVSYTVSFKSIEAKLDVTELSLNVGQKATVKASFPTGSSISGSPNMTWESDDDYIATVSSKSGSTNWTGTVKAVSSGRTKITFDPVIGPPCYCYVDVAYIAPKSAELTPNPLNVTVGKTKTIKVSYAPKGASAKKTTWVSSNTNVATVSTSGVVKGVAEGEATITVTTDNGITATAKVIVLPLPTSVYLPATANINLGYSKTLTPTVSPANCETTYKWSSSDTSVATVSSGKVTGKKEGTAKITVTTENGKTSECVVTVKNTNLNLDYRNANNRASAIESLVKRTFNKK